ncbi:MAG: cytochrome c maturation protein CcmE [Thermodesulfobacteriota bacterium]
MFKGRLKFIVAIGIISLTVAYLVYAGVKDTMVYYLTIDELKDRVPEVYDDKVRVSGTVVEGSIKNDLDSSLEFQITDGNQVVNVFYKGIVPDVFREGVEAVVEGNYQPGNVFKAKLLLAKCPTKYESEDSIYKKEKT